MLNILDTHFCYICSLRTSTDTLTFRRVYKSSKQVAEMSSNVTRKLNGLEPFSVFDTHVFLSFNNSSKGSAMGKISP